MDLREPALAALWDITTPDGADRRFRDEMFPRLPRHFRPAVSLRYRKEYEKGGIAAANALLHRIRDAVTGCAWRLSASDDELCCYAADQAEKCGRMAATAGDAAYLYLAEACSASGIDAPQVDDDITEAGAVARMCDALWWRRQIRRTHGRQVEAVAIDLDLVHRRGGMYASDESTARRKEQRTRNRRMLESCYAVNELGQSYTLAELVDLSVSNPAIRRGELMVRMAGFEQNADRMGHVGEFYTWTCPSRMHSHMSKSGERNPIFDGTTPREAQQYLCAQWAKARAALARQGVALYGFRVAEPHHDGTPHWHMLFFMPPEHRGAVRQVLRKYALQVDGDERGAAKHRFEAVAMDKRKGTAAGYLAKYVAKNIDGFGLQSVDDDLFGRSPEACARRVDAWASTWGVRQFQQVGGPSVTVWRELRRLGDKEQAQEEIEAARFRAHKGDWAGYVAVMGGAVAARGDRPLCLAKAWSDKPGRYGEALGDRVIGVECGAVVVVTRVHEWRVERGKKGVVDCIGVEGEGSTSRRERRESERSDFRDGVGAGCFGFEVGGIAARPWSPVNNCTEVLDDIEYGAHRRAESIGRKGGKNAAPDASRSYHAAGARTDRGAGIPAAPD